MTDLFALPHHDPELRPALRSDLASLQIGSEQIVWSPDSRSPAYLDPVAALISSVLDGSATRTELSHDVSDALGVERDVAVAHVERTIELLADGSALRLPSSQTADVEVPRHSLPPPNW